MKNKIRGILLFDTSSVERLQNVRSQILADNRRFAIIWSVVQFIYGTYSYVMSFFNESYERCRYVYVAIMVISVLAFLFAEIVAQKKPLLVYISMFLNDVSLFGSGLFIAWILLRVGTGTIMIFAAAILVPILFVNNTLLNIITAVIDIVVAVFLMRNGLSSEMYGWVISNLIIFSSMGVSIGHFINKARFERHVFAESAVQLAESNAKLAELRTKFAYFDQMTGLMNRRAYSEKIEKFSNEMPERCCIVAADVNGLKRTNDTFGHEAGDELIVGAAECLRGSFPGVDTIYRFGGDEFSVITDMTEEEVKKCLVEFEKKCADWKGDYINGISVSYGIASAEEFSDMDSVLKAADKRMYEFKRDYYMSSGHDRRSK